MARCISSINRSCRYWRIVLTPPPYNPPGRIAERIAMLDLVSDGRVEFGTGESSSANELDAYHVPWDEKKAMWRRAPASRCG